MRLLHWIVNLNQFFGFIWLKRVTMSHSWSKIVCLVGWRIVANAAMSFKMFDLNTFLVNSWQILSSITLMLNNCIRWFLSGYFQRWVFNFFNFLNVFNSDIEWAIQLFTLFITIKSSMINIREVSKGCWLDAMSKRSI